MRAFRIAYDGRPFYGFQRQPDVPTVEDALLDALETLDVLDGEDPAADSEADADAEASGGIRPIPPGYAAAGRTDAGVSALAQAVAFQAPEWLTPRAFSARLPETVHVWAHADVPQEEPDAAADFHATHRPVRRCYVYHLHAPEADPDLGAAAISRLTGHHDFAALTPDDTGTVRTLEIGYEWEAPYLELEVAAGGFPRHLVRRIASLVRLVAEGERPPSFVDSLLDGSTASGSAGVPTAAAEPLVLAAVEYPELAFTVDETAANDARARLAERRIRLTTQARTLQRVGDGIG